MVLNLRSAALCFLLSFSTATKTAEDVERILAHRRRHLQASGELQSAHITPIAKTDYSTQELEEAESLTQAQLNPMYEETLEPLDLVKENEIQMSRLSCEPDSCNADKTECTKCSCTYCMTNSILVSESPEKYPSHMHVTDTEHCRVQAKEFGLNALHTELKAFDDAADSPTESLPVDMFVFEMGFTDSDRLTKALSADPSSLVLVNPQPMYEALMMCYDKRKTALNKHSADACDTGLVEGLLQKVAYMLCRVPKSDGYDNCVIKMWADASVAISVAEAAFPDATFEYIYTEPEQYMGGVIFDPVRTIRAPCAKQKRNPSEIMKAACLERGVNCQDLTIEELCALESELSMDAIVKQKNASGRMNFVHADDIAIRLDEIADRLHKTQGVGIPAAVRDKARDVMDKDTRGNKDPDKHTKNKNDRAKKVSTKGRDAIRDMLTASSNAIKNFDTTTPGR